MFSTAATALFREGEQEMYRVVRTATLRTLRADAEGVPGLRADAEGAWAEVERLRGQLDRARAETGEQFEGLLAVIRQVTGERDQARADGELEALRAQMFLDTEDRATLRMLLRIVRKQSRPADRVYVLFRRGELHSVHATIEAAEVAAEAEGASRSGWTRNVPGAGLPPAAEEAWRVQPLPLGGVH